MLNGAMKSTALSFLFLAIGTSLVVLTEDFLVLVLSAEFSKFCGGFVRAVLRAFLHRWRREIR